MIVVVQNFQSLGDVTLGIAGLTALVGPSDRGKSALVRAIQAAFFNLPGEYFVRTGATSARVVVEWGTADGAKHAVVWEKGGGVNQYEVDGVSYSKVGRDAPPILQTLGFRDELIGARVTDSGSEGGKWVRPQIAEQFDEIFLLKESGTFINEVIVKLSRLGVLQKASRHCALDLRSAKTLLKTRRGDLEIATADAEKLAEAPLLRSRLDGLLTMDAEIEARVVVVANLTRLLPRRAAAHALAGQSLPEPRQTEEIHAALDQYRELVQARQGVERRVRLAKLPKSLPPAAVNSPGHAALAVGIERWKNLQQMIGARTMRETVVERATSALQTVEARCHEIQDKITALKARTPVCPLCLRPWTETHAHPTRGVA